MLDINWQPKHKELRQFAMLLIAAAVVLGVVEFRKTGAIDMSQRTADWMIFAAFLAGVIGVAVPALIKPVYLAWVVVAYPIGWSGSYLLLGILYYLVLTPIGLLIRAAGKDPMNRRFEQDARTHWVEHRTGGDASTYFQQF
jgi:hypothetical protein